MENTLKIKCKSQQNCKSQIKQDLDGVAEVRDVIANQNDGIMTVTLDADATYETLKKAVEEQGYTVID